MENQAQLTPYQPNWTDDYNAEERHLQGIFGAAALEIQHIGSTAIAGMPSNPIIDIAVMIQSWKDADAFTESLEQIGYEFVPATHSGLPERHFYTKSNPRQFHLSIAYTDHGGFWVRQILFRDYLRANHDAHKEYAELKKELIRKFPSGRGPYSEGKTAFVYRILRLAGWKVGQAYQGSGLSTSEASPMVTEVIPKQDNSLVVTFDTGETGLLDMNSWMRTGTFDEITTYDDFAAVRVANGTVEWDCGITMDPHYVYGRTRRTI